MGTCAAWTYFAPLDQWFPQYNYCDNCDEDPERSSHSFEITVTLVIMVMKMILNEMMVLVIRMMMMKKKKKKKVNILVISGS